MCRLAILTLATQFLSPGPLAPFDSALVLILHAPRLAITINCETVRVVIRRDFFFFSSFLTACLDAVYIVCRSVPMNKIEGEEK